MIARLWHGVTHASKADAYLDLQYKVAFPDYQAIDGNRGVYILRRLEDDHAHFVLLTLWDSSEAIQQFAGPDMEKAKYYPHDEQFLLEFEPTVTHYEVFVPSDEHVLRTDRASGGHSGQGS